MDANSDDEGSWRVELRGDGPLGPPDTVTEIQCWRLTVGQGHHHKPRLRPDGLDVSFGTVPLDSLTSFFAFEVKARDGQIAESVRFVVNADLVGAPPDRAENLLARLLRNRSDLIRYLLYLLTDAADGLAGLFEGLGDLVGAKQERRPVLSEPALMESLLRTLATDPTRLTHVRKVLADLDKAGRTEVLPEGLAELWEAIEPVWRELADLPDDEVVP